MRVLTVDGALARCSVALIEGERLVTERHHDGLDGRAGRLASMAAQVLTAAGRVVAELDLLAVTVGPGGFTGIRAALALAHGMGLAAGIPVVGVTVGEALAFAAPHFDGRCLWTAIDSRRGRVFLERAVSVGAFALDALPDPNGPIAVGGNAAVVVAATLAGRGCDVIVTDPSLPEPNHIALAARRRADGLLPSRPAMPLYVDAPAARLPAGGLRPPPIR